MNTNKKQYTSPELTVVTFKIEKGYVDSTWPTPSSGIGIEEAFAQTMDDRTQEEWNLDRTTYFNQGWQ